MSSSLLPSYMHNSLPSIPRFLCLCNVSLISQTPNYLSNCVTCIAHIAFFNEIVSFTCEGEARQSKRQHVGMFHGNFVQLFHFFSSMLQQIEWRSRESPIVPRSLLVHWQCGRLRWDMFLLNFSPILCTSCFSMLQQIEWRSMISSFWVHWSCGTLPTLPQSYMGSWTWYKRATPPPPPQNPPHQKQNWRSFSTKST